MATDARRGVRPSRAVGVLALVAVLGALGGAAARLVDGRGFAAAPRLTASALPQVVRLLRDGGQLRVPVSFTIGGPSWPMLLDTGAPTMVPPALADMHGAVRVGSRSVRSPGAAASSLDLVTLPRLYLGDMAFRDVNVIVAGVGTGDLVDRGVVGADLLQAGVWRLDPSAGTLTLVRDMTSLEHPAGAIALQFLPAARASPSPIVDLVVGGVPHRFLVDTGSDGGLSIHPADVGLTDAESAGSAHIETLDGYRRVTVRRVLLDVAIGDQPPMRVPVDVSDALDPGLGLMGNAFLARYVVTIDWPSRRIYLADIDRPVGQTMRAAEGHGADTLR